MLKNYIMFQMYLLSILVLLLWIIWFFWNRLETEYKKEYKISKNLYLEKEKQRKEKIEKEKFLSHIKSLDLETDSSLTKFVSSSVSFDDISYVPNDLVPVEWKYIIDWKWWSIKVSRIAKEKFDQLSKHFYSDTNNNIVVVSWYRSYNYQKGIKDRGCPDNLCAKAWYSEHQSGLAIDIYSASSERNWANDNNLKKYYSWFSENAHKYGFHQTYRKGLEIDWYEVEPWHWRYVWKDLALYLKENDITFSEFYNSMKPWNLALKK